MGDRPRPPAGYRRDGLVEIVREGEHLECQSLGIRLSLDEVLTV